ncbi:MAG TPA: hypothetical protein VG125_19255 [Pirellulales bacterium]|jgi:hypothetical protein|nr:hypothetical protein [Pirellulales bacterium]
MGAINENPYRAPAEGDQGLQGAAKARRPWWLFITTVAAAIYLSACAWELAHGRRPMSAMLSATSLIIAALLAAICRQYYR